MKKPVHTAQPAKVDPDGEGAVPGPVFLPPFRPHRRLFYALMGGMGIWIGVLLTLYFTTVYPTHHVAPSPTATQRTVPQ